MRNLKKVLFIGAGWEQKDLIIKAKKIGFKIIATHPHFDNSVVEIVDRYFIRESNDIESHLKLAINYKVNAIITDNCDYSLYTAAFISEKLDLLSVGLEAAVTAIFKDIQRVKCLNAINVNQPEFYKFNTIQDYKLGVNSLKFPFIVKPNDSRGTFGVTIVRDNSQVMDAFYHAITNSPSRTGIIEEFIEGILFTVDGFCFDDGHKSLGVASRKFEKGNIPITKEIIYPAQVSKAILERLKGAHESVVSSLDYKKGHTHGEYIVDDKGDVYLVECTNRGGGVYTSSTIVPEVSGIDLNEALIRQMTGEKFIGENPETNPVILAFIDLEVGKTVKSINIKKLPNVLKFRSIYSEKDMVESVKNCASRHMMLVIKGGVEELNEFKEELDIKYY